MRRCRPRAGLLTAVLVAVGVLTTAIPARADTPGRADVRAVARAAMSAYDLRALVVRVTADGENVYTGALGESMTGVPATTRMHFRNGAMAFTYIGTIVAQLVDAKRMRLDDPLAYDMTRSMELVGRGALVSKRMYRLQTGNRLAGFGAADPTGACGPCRPLTEERSYGFGVILQGDWITQTKFFAGSGATTGYLPDAGLAITVVTTLGPAAFDETGAAGNPSSAVFGEIARLMAPEASAVLP